MNNLFQTLYKHKLLVLFLLVIGVLYIQDPVKSFFLVTLQKSELPHYQAAIKISPEEFQNIQTEFSLSFGEYGEETLIDTVEDIYYEIPYTTLFDYGEKSAHLRKYIHGTSSEGEEFTIPLDERFAANGGLACFSCGCSCYVDRTFAIVGGETFFLSSGLDYAMPPERQGLYYQNDDGTWSKLTPKLPIGSGGFQKLQSDLKTGDSLKIFDKGCSVAYPYGKEFYKLNVCSKPADYNPRAQVEEKPVVMADEFKIMISGVDTTRKYDMSSSITATWKVIGEAKDPELDTWVGFMLVNEETKREFFLTDALWRSGPVELYFDRASNDRGQRIQPGKYRLKAYMYGTDDRVYPFALSDVFEVYAVKGAPSLTWALYTSADPNDPVTSIDVRLRRADGSSVSTIVASVNAYCNEEDPTADLALDSTQLLCYYAGLGHEFRIIDRNGSYVVQKREFEEASPDYNPPVTGFEDVVTID